MTKKHYRVYVVADDPHCCGLMQFDAYTALLADEFSLIVDGITFKSSDGFHDLQEGWIN
jgi:hypothetical protein